MTWNQRTSLGTLSTMSRSNKKYEMGGTACKSSITASPRAAIDPELAVYPALASAPSESDRCPCGRGVKCQEAGVCQEALSNPITSQDVCVKKRHA